MSDILIGVIVFELVFGAAIFGMFLGRNPRVLGGAYAPRVLVSAARRNDIFRWHCGALVTQTAVRQITKPFRFSAISNQQSEIRNLRISRAVTDRSPRSRS